MKEVDPELAAPDSPFTTVDEAPSKPLKMTVSVATDQALVVRAPGGLKTLILGNPAIADVNAQKHGILVVTGKTYGVTNLVLVGDEGKILGEALIQVQAPKYGIVSVQRGMEKESYSCTPKCNPTVVLGDSQQYFSETSQQSTARAGWVSAGSTGR
ncbi:pilus assembly protein N-terminal domain-containing protein [Microvirga tunisiensis]|uniref:pilus assembly protein N-terminal domain-containing protein n=1 Tax=Microvirga tunisiensis TaxID=2108360 RepID=UPI0013871CD2